MVMKENMNNKINQSAKHSMSPAQIYDIYSHTYCTRRRDCEYIFATKILRELACTSCESPHELSYPASFQQQQSTRSFLLSGGAIKFASLCALYYYHKYGLGLP